MSNMTPVGKDTYMVGVSVRGGFTSDAEVKAKAWTMPMRSTPVEEK